LRLPDSTRLQDFWSALAAAPAAALLLDYDGTLAPFHIDPAKARPYPGVETLLDRLGRLPGDRLVIVSGRALDDLEPLLQLDVRPEWWGCHGRERRLPDGRHRVTPLPDAAQQALAEAEGWLATVTATGGRVERKPGSLAFHWRGLAPGHQRALERDLETRFAALAQAGALQWHAFDGGIELRAAGCDKGEAVRQVLSELNDDACVAYLGDDHTDEDAFRALDGRGLRVLVRPKWRATAADLWLRPPAGLCAFLGRWADIREQHR
jgi:trehalose-phosphatase